MFVSAQGGFCMCLTMLFCFCRMDDIQLCKDIMNLKSELQNLVAIPGNGYFLTQYQDNAWVMHRWGWCQEHSSAPNNQKRTPKVEFHISFLPSLYLFPISLSIFNLLISKFLFMLYFTAALKPAATLHITQGAHSLYSLGNLKGDTWHRNCQVKKMVLTYQR